MAEDENSSMPGWAAAAFNKDEEPPARRRVSPTAVVVVAGVVAAGVVAAGALWPEPAPTRTVASEPDAAPTALPTASATPAPTLPTDPPAPTSSDTEGPPADAASPPAGDGASPPAGDGAQPPPPSGQPAGPGAGDQGPAGQGVPAQPAAPPAPAPAPDPAPAPPPAPASPPAPQAMGPLDAFVTAAVPATSPDAVDGANRPVSYEAANLLDGHPSTAWRADGDLTGQVLTFTFDTPREISRAGLINGYAKVDPVTHADRYAQGRRITRVTWIIDGQEIVQELGGHDRHPQTATFPPVTTQQVAMRIDAVTAPGHPRFDETVISEVVLADG